MFSSGWAVSLHMSRDFFGGLGALAFSIDKWFLGDEVQPVEGVSGSRTLALSDVCLFLGVSQGQ
jgi:hypothetical protein